MGVLESEARMKISVPCSLKTSSEKLDLLRNSEIALSKNLVLILIRVSTSPPDSAIPFFVVKK